LWWRETVPDWVLQRVNEVVMIDLTPEALQNRMRRGDVYPQERVGRALNNFFRGDEPDRFAGTGVAPGGATGGPEPGTASRSGGEGSGASCHPRTHCRMHQLESGGTVPGGARRAHGAGHEWPSYLCSIPHGQDTSEANQRTLAANVRFAENVGASIVRLKGKSVASAVAEFVNEKTHFAGGFLAARRHKAGNDISIFWRFISFCATRQPWTCTS